MRLPPLPGVWIVAALLWLTGCRAPAPPPAIEVQPWPLAADTVAGQPDLIASTDGTLLLSWLSPHEDGHALRYARYAHGRWQQPVQIARGSDWFVNWADTPHLMASADGALWAQWLRKSADAPYAYDVVVSRANDGLHWSEPVTVHNDGTASEHGFAALWPQGVDGLGIAWLDGRNTVASAGHHAHADGQGVMTLRAAQLDAHLQVSGEQQLDPMTCDCCQTAVARTDAGPLLVYRGRSEAEIRDIQFTTYAGGQWSAPRTVHDDHWTMPACPVNGPAVAAHGGTAWVAWYTATQDTPQLRLSQRRAHQGQFSAPVTVDSGAQVQGRVQVAADANGVWVTWIGEDTHGQSLWLARYDTEGVQQGHNVTVAQLAGRGRATGFPRMVADAHGAHLVWTDIEHGKPALHGARVTLTR